jgi:hypothetical protein
MWRSLSSGGPIEGLAQIVKLIVANAGRYPEVFQGGRLSGLVGATCNMGMPIDNPASNTDSIEMLGFAMIIGENNVGSP